MSRRWEGEAPVENLDYFRKKDLLFLYIYNYGPFEGEPWTNVFNAFLRNTALVGFSSYLNTFWKN